MYLTKKQRRIMQQKDVEVRWARARARIRRWRVNHSPSVSAIYPSYGSWSGGTVVMDQVSDSSRVTGAKIAGVAVANLTAVSPTMVRGTTGSRRRNPGDVVLQSAAGDFSSTFANGYQYFDPTDRNYSPSAAYVAPNYDDTPNHGRGTRAQAWMSTGGRRPAPGNIGGSPLFDGSTSQALVAHRARVDVVQVNDRRRCGGRLGRHQQQRHRDTTYGNNAIVVDFPTRSSDVSIYHAGAEPYTLPQIFGGTTSGLRSRKATLDITSSATRLARRDTHPRDRKKSENLQIRANGSSWTVRMRAARALSAGTRTGTIKLATRGYYAGGKINGTIRALVITGSAQSARVLDNSGGVGQYVSRTVDGCVDSRTCSRKRGRGPDRSHLCWASSCGSGRRLIIGGFNTEGLGMGWHIRLSRSPDERLF